MDATSGWLAIERSTFSWSESVSKRAENSRRLTRLQPAHDSEMRIRLASLKICQQDRRIRDVLDIAFDDSRQLFATNRLRSRFSSNAR